MSVAVDRCSAFKRASTREQTYSRRFSDTLERLLLLQRTTVESGDHRLHVTVTRDIGVRAAVRRIRGGAEYSPLRHDHIEIAALQSIGILLRWCHCDGRAGA